MQKHISVAQPYFERVNTGTSLTFIALKTGAHCLLTLAGRGSMSRLEGGWGNKQNIGSVCKWLLISACLLRAVSMPEPKWALRSSMVCMQILLLAGVQ